MKSKKGKIDGRFSVLPLVQVYHRRSSASYSRIILQNSLQAYFLGCVFSAVQPHLRALTTLIHIHTQAVRVKRFQVKVSRHAELHWFHTGILQIEGQDLSWYIREWKPRIFQALEIISS